MGNVQKTNNDGGTVPRKISTATLFWVLLAVAVIAYGSWLQKREAGSASRSPQTSSSRAKVPTATGTTVANDQGVYDEAASRARAASDVDARTESNNPVADASAATRAAPATEMDRKGNLRNQPAASDGDSGKRSAAVSRPAPKPVEPPDEVPNRMVVKGVKVRDLDGKIVYEGPIDLTETLTRIKSGERLRFRNDGSVFMNRERRLPVKDVGYYREWVHPTDELDGPGPQRVVTGEKGEIYFTHDHYRTFKKLK